MSKISKIFENDSSESESDLSEEEEYEYDNIDENFYQSEEEDDYQSDEEEYDNKYNNVFRDKDQVITESFREKSRTLLTNNFKKYELAKKNISEKVKEIEELIYEKSDNILKNYLDLVRIVYTGCFNYTFMQLRNVVNDYFNSVPFAKCKKVDDKHLNNITCRLEPVSGIHKCKCGCEKVYSYELQTRSADEGMTLFLQCYDCGRKWKL
jgi:DNA-directed RNA polymerase subunit M/transcription elongation factor TFIIS